MRSRLPRLLICIGAALSLIASGRADAQTESASLGQNGTTLLSTVRDATAIYRDPNLAISDGWVPLTGCVSGPQEGAMGTHFINTTVLGDPALDPRQPEALIYEHRRGRATLVGVEFITLASAWHATNSAPPVLMGQHFHYVGSPNRYGLEPFYELHVWAWRDNPGGNFADWHRHVSCDGATDQ